MSIANELHSCHVLLTQEKREAQFDPNETIYEDMIVFFPG